MTYLARRVTGHRIRVYPLKGLPPHKAATFDPGDCALVRAGLSGPGAYATGESSMDAKYNLLRVEEMLDGR